MTNQGNDVPPAVFRTTEYEGDYIQKFINFLDISPTPDLSQHWTGLYPDSLQYFLYEISGMAAQIKEVQEKIATKEGLIPIIMAAANTELEKIKEMLFHVTKVLQARCLLLVTRGVSHSLSDPPVVMDSVEAAKEALLFMQHMRQALGDAGMTVPW